MAFNAPNPGLKGQKKKRQSPTPRLALPSEKIPKRLCPGMSRLVCATLAKTYLRNNQRKPMKVVVHFKLHAIFPVSNKAFIHVPCSHIFPFSYPSCFCLIYRHSTRYWMIFEIGKFCHVIDFLAVSANLSLHYMRLQAFVEVRHAY